MIYFRRPQTPFVQDEGSQKPYSQWKLIADGNDQADLQQQQQQEEDMNHSSNSSGLGLGGGSSHHDSEEFGDLVEKDPPLSPRESAAAKDTTDQDQEEPALSAEDPLSPNNNIANEGDTASTITTTNDNDGTDEELAVSLDRRLQLQLKYHPESVLLCGYFHEEIVDDCLALSTYLPGVHSRELRVYYGECVLKIAGARALYNLVQRFERSFALDDRLLQTNDIRAILHEGMLMIRVPLVEIPPPPVKINVVEANPFILTFLINREENFCLDIDVPGVKLNDLTVEYNNGTIRLLWERLEPAVSSSSSSPTTSPTSNINSNSTTTDKDSNISANNSLNTTRQYQKTMMRFERVIPINTLQMDTNKLQAYLDHITKPTGVLTIVAPFKYKRSTRPIQVQTAKELQLLEQDEQDGISTNGSLEMDQE